MKYKYITLIPAKKKSSRLKNKNLTKIGKKMLFEYTLEASINCKDIYQTYISSDSKKILEVSRKKGAYIHLRPKVFAKKNSTANEVILNFLKSLNLKKYKNYYLVYLQPTSPLRTHKHISKAIWLSKKFPTHTIISASVQDRSVLKSIIKNKNNDILISKRFFNDNDQNLPEVFLPNGAIYIFSLNNYFKSKKKIPLNKIKIFKMTKKDSVDINTKEDLKKIAIN